jgi:hypothetical protein
METLREEFSSAPESSSSSGVSKTNVDQQRLQEEANERKNFEEERFVRMVYLYIYIYVYVYIYICTYI